MNPEHTEERNAQHMARHDAAVDALRAAYAAYQEWQEDEGDWDTFVDWVDDEGGPSTCGATRRRLGEFDVDDPPEAPAVDTLREPEDETCARCDKPYKAHVLETYPPQHADCKGFECAEDHDASGLPCPLRSVEHCGAVGCDNSGTCTCDCGMCARAKGVAGI